MNDTPNLSLPFILAAQAQKHVTHNEAILALDALVQLSVVDRDLTAPPPSPAEGARYIVAAAATGAWAGQDGRVAAFQDGAWAFYVPNEGWLAWVADEDVMLAHNGAAWISAGRFEHVGINATADAANRLALNSPAALFNHAGNGHTLKINKAAAGDTASLVLQTGFSTRAELGALGDDDLRLKVSANGSDFNEAMVADKDTGAVDLPVGPKFSATTNYENYIAANTWTKIAFNVATHNDQNDFDAANNRLVAPVDGYYLIGAKWRFKANAAVPASIQTKLYKNGSAEARTAVESWATVVTERTHLVTFDLFKLAATDYVEVFAYMETNDGYVDDDGSLFWGARVA